jgi:alpha-ketoglutarate-dependent taurine dioxygenase
VIAETATDPRAWRAATIDVSTSWYHSLSAHCLAALEETIRRLRDHPQPIHSLRASDEPCASRADEILPAKAALDKGRGFVILRGLTPDRFSSYEMQVCYWLLGGLLGQAVEQNVQGTLLYDVRDTGQDVHYGARFSVTNAESSFHTDNSFGSGIVDYVGLLCLQTARSGGLSQVVSGCSVHKELLARHPDLLNLLSQSWHIDRRGGLRPGEAPTVQYPVVSRENGDLTYRYLRFWIESGHEKIGQPLSAVQRKALDTLDEVLNDPALRVEFALAPGDVYFINNRWILHNRTAFEDHAEPERRRHLVRLWLRNESRLR